MPLNKDIENQLEQFVQQSSFASHGGVITDLDGTAVHEYQGKIIIPEPVELGLKQLYDLGRPLVLNSLRFPLSVLRTFGRGWYDISNTPVPTVSLNGSLLGYVTNTPQDELVFEEIAAFPLSAEEINEALKGVEGLLDGGIKDILVFYYPRDWRIGEVIWTPVPEKVIPIKEKYASASSVTAVEFPKLRDQMLSEDVCMIFLLIEVEQDKLMAYQHTKRANFFTRKGVDKLFGAQQMAAALGFDLAHSLGAGDAELDNFLSAVGLAVLVGNHNLEFRGLLQTIKIKNSFEFGELLFRMAELQRIKNNDKGA
ncbi:MAG: HAD hydrolase family protein [Acidobacteriota bacterium]|nr:HAD hydrolase family protein [Acidobacteriota bacterium]